MKPMGRFFKAVPLALLFFFTAAPAQAANIPLFSPGWSIVPEACRECPCGVGGALQFIQNIMNAAVSLGVIMFIFVIVYVGILFTLSATNPEAKSKAKTLLANAVIGFIIVLAAWLVVDYVMKFVYNPEAAFDGKKIGPWNEIIQFKGGSCIDPQDIKPIAGLPKVIDTIVNVGGGFTGGGGPVGDVGRYPNTGACSPQNVRAAAVLGGYSMSEHQATMLACMAGPESGCGTQMQNYNWNGAKSKPPSTAWGPFQITLKGNSKCFENQACYKAAGVTGPLNCEDAFNSGGYAIPGTRLSSCQKAAATLSCSAVAAGCVAKEQGYGAWTTDKNSTKQKACIAKYGN